MATIGIELCDAGFLTAACDKSDSRVIDVADANGVADWPGFCYHDGAQLTFGRAAEDQWFVHPRRVVHTFWSRLAHEPSPIHQIGRAHGCTPVTSETRIPPSACKNREGHVP